VNRSCLHRASLTSSVERVCACASLLCLAPARCRHAQFNRLVEPPQLRHNVALRSINLSHNGLTSVAPWLSLELPALTTLNLSHNNLTTLYPLRSLTTLRELWIAANRVEELQEVVALSTLPVLATLVMYSNPVCKLHEPESLKYGCSPSRACPLSAISGARLPCRCVTLAVACCMSCPGTT
jgi:hypothetical protein